MATEVQLIARARDEASKVLQGLQANMKQLFGPSGEIVSDWGRRVKDTDAQVMGLDVSATKLARTARNLALPIAGELSPAFGQLSVQMVNVVQGATLMGPTLAGVALAAAGLAGIVMGQLVGSFKTVSEAKRAFNEALSTGDIAKTTAEIGKLTASLHGLYDIGLLQQGGPIAARARADVAGRVGEGLKDLDALKQSQLLGQLGEGMNAGETEGKEIKARAEVLRRATELAQRGLYDFQLDPIEATYQASLRGASDLARQPGGEEGAARARQAAKDARADALRRRRLGFLRGDAPSYDEGAGYGIAQDELDRISARTAYEGFDRTRELDLALAAAGGNEGAAYGITPEQLRAGSEKSQKISADAARDLLATKRDQLAVEQQVLGLSQDQSEALAAQRIEAERVLKIKEAGEDLDKQALANREAEVQLSNIAYSRRLRTDAGAGFAEGFRQAAEEGEAWGTQMQDMARRTASGMNDALSEGFFSLAKGQFQNLGDIGKRWSDTLLRTLTDTLAKGATGAITRSISDMLSGTSTGSRGLLAGIPFLSDLVGDTKAGVVEIGGRYLPASDVAAAYEAGGPTMVRALGSGDVAIQGGRVVASPSFTNSPDVGLVPSSVAANAGGGFNYGQAAGVGLSTALYGLSVYSATQNTRTTTDVAVGAAMGALQGALIGYQAGEAAGYGTSGALIGALAGAAISAGAGAYGKNQSEKKEAEARKRREIEAAASGAQDLVSAANRAKTLGEFWQALASHGSGSTGGTSPLATITTVQTPGGSRMIGERGDVYPVANVNELFDYLPSLRSNVQAGIPQAERDTINAQTDAALLQRGQELLDDYNSRLAGIEVISEEQVGDLTKKTVVPGGRANVLAGRQLMVGLENLDDLAPDEREIFIRALVAYDFDHSIGAFRDDPEAGVHVSISSIFATQVGGPGSNPGGIGDGNGSAGPGAGAPVLPAFAFTPLGLPPTPAPAILNEPTPEGGLVSYYNPAYNAAADAAYTQAVAERSASARAQVESFFDGLTPEQRVAVLRNPPAALRQAMRLMNGQDLAEVVESIGDQVIQDGESNDPGDGPPGSTDPSGLPSINVVDAVVDAVSSNPQGIVGQGVSLGLQAMGLNAPTANTLGNLGNLAISIFGGPFAGLANTALGIIGQIAQGVPVPQALLNAVLGPFAGIFSGSQGPHGSFNMSQATQTALGLQRSGERSMAAPSRSGGDDPTDPDVDLSEVDINDTADAGIGGTSGVGGPSGNAGNAGGEGGGVGGSAAP